MQTGNVDQVDKDLGFLMTDFENTCASCHDSPLEFLGALIYRPETGGFDALCIPCIAFMFRAADLAIKRNIVPQELDDADLV